MSASAALGSEDGVEALARVIYEAASDAADARWDSLRRLGATGLYFLQARAILASDWLAAHDAALLANHSRELGERIAAAKAEAVAEFARAAYNEWPIGSCAHKCFREDEHIAPKDCLHGPDWLIARAVSSGSADEAGAR